MASSPSSPRPSALSSALTRWGTLVLDGAMATELEGLGADLSGGLWSARVLRDQPELISEVHRSYLAAGADVVITAGYQASVPGFVRAGSTRAEAEQLIRRSVELAVEVRDEFWAAALADDPGVLDRRPRPVVATSVGPYGAVLADGSEYRGDYDLSHRDLVRFHRERLAVLAPAGPEVLACETLPSLAEAEALLEALSGWPELTAWVSFSARDGHRTSDGSLVSDCAALLDRADQVVAVGVNCTAVQHVATLVGEVTQATGKPVVVYPNSGETYDAGSGTWRGSPTLVDFEALAGEWSTAGARLIGGCCRTGPAEIRAVSAALRGAGPSGA